MRQRQRQRKGKITLKTIKSSCRTVCGLPVFSVLKLLSMSVEYVRLHQRMNICKECKGYDHKTRGDIILYVTMQQQYILFQSDCSCLAIRNTQTILTVTNGSSKRYFHPLTTFMSIIVQNILPHPYFCDLHMQSFAGRGGCQ